LRIQEQCHHRAPQFAGVGPHRPQRRFAFQRQLDPFSGQTAQHALHVRGGRVQATTGLQQLAPSETSNR
jgi:hypothetical protein